MESRPPDSWGDLVSATWPLATGSERRILGIVGAPGAGKSVLAQRLVDLLTLRGCQVALAAMDGFHLAGAELTRLARADRKGAPDTFDIDGYLSLLHRLRNRDESIVYAPLFDRGLEEPIGAAVAIPAHVPLIITEGNYLLHPVGRWAEVAELLDECWYVDIDERTRLERLVERHMQFGRSRAEAVGRSQGSDLRNAELVIESRPFATRYVIVPELARA